MAIANKCTWVTFSLAWEDGADSVEVFHSFKYLGRILHWSDDKLPAVLRNIQKLKQSWGHLGKLLWQEGVDPIIS